MKTMWAPWRMEYILSEKDNEPGACIFCSRLEQDKDKENLILRRGRRAFIIMNRYPYNNGHLMVVPNRHSGDILELPPAEHAEVFELIQLSVKALNEVMHPQAFNIGMNLGRVAGAGVTDHLHYHIVPRWNGDTNFMPVLTDTKVVSEALDQSYDKLLKAIREIEGTK